MSKKSQKQIANLASRHGYQREGHGYKRVTELFTHWISDLSSSDSIQLYSYYTTDSEFEKQYDSGVLSNWEYESIDRMIHTFLLNFD